MAYGRPGIANQRAAARQNIHPVPVLSQSASTNNSVPTVPQLMGVFEKFDAICGRRANGQCKC
eukprot:3671151-Lingulodinium_polyedra.AAC.1